MFSNNQLDKLIIIFINCQYLESIKIYCGKVYLNERKILETVANYSPNNFRELKICNNLLSLNLISPEYLESFFVS